MIKKSELAPIRRYEFPDDRFDFNRWVKSPGPTRRPYWRYDFFKGVLFIEIEKNGEIVAYALEESDLLMSRNGWRKLVADALRQVRAFLNQGNSLKNTS